MVLRLVRYSDRDDPCAPAPNLFQVAPGCPACGPGHGPMVRDRGPSVFCTHQWAVARMVRGRWITGMWLSSSQFVPQLNSVAADTSSSSSTISTSRELPVDPLAPIQNSRGKRLHSSRTVESVEKIRGVCMHSILHLVFLKARLRFSSTAFGVQVTSSHTALISTISYPILRVAFDAPRFYLSDVLYIRNAANAFRMGVF